MAELFLLLCMLHMLHILSYVGDSWFLVVLSYQLSVVWLSAIINRL